MAFSFNPPIERPFGNGTPQMWETVRVFGFVEFLRRPPRSAVDRPPTENHARPNQTRGADVVDHTPTPPNNLVGTYYHRMPIC